MAGAVSPSKQWTEHIAMPRVDDLLFLLSIVSNPNSFIAEHSQETEEPDDAQRTNTTPINGEGKVTVGYTSWQKTLMSLPTRRRDMVLALHRLENARQKWNNVSTLTDQENESNVNRTDTGLPYNDEAVALEEVEHAASAIRLCAEDYLELAKEYTSSLQKNWGCRTNPSNNENYNCSDLSSIGSQLASQLTLQIQWDEKLSIAIIKFLDEELYNNSINHRHSQLRTTTEKLRVWADAMSRMIKINKSFWDFVEREVYDETELEQEKEVPELLNFEPSTKLMCICPSNEVEHDHKGGMIGQSTSENSGIKEDDLHERIVSSDSVEEAIETFMKSEVKKEDVDRPSHEFQQKRRCITSILLVGEEGCGKTHLIDSIQKQHQSGTKFLKKSSSIKVLRPRYPVDLVGNSIGSSEDRLLALFTYVSRFVSTTSENNGERKKCLVMLDDIDHMFSVSNDNYGESSDVGNSTQYYIGRRCKSLFVTILDALREHSPSVEDGHLLLLCTSRTDCGELVDRFDRTFRRGQPDQKQRRRLLTSCLSIENVDGAFGDADSYGADIEAKVSLIVQHSAGRSSFELSQCCREAILSCARSASYNDEGNSSISLRRLQFLDKMLQTKSPQSLRGGSLDGIVDMRVSTPEELQSNLTVDANGLVKMPLLGLEAKRAYEALMNVVITPLCRSDNIQDLLYGGSGSGNGVVDEKPIRVGALLAGAPGVGKTSLAYHCASLAAKMSRASLLDVSCTSLIHKEIGGSERAVQQLFAAVRAAAPCILLLDGIENVAPRRGNDNTSEGTMDRVLSTFLTEMDGIETNRDGASSGNVAVVGITHNPDLIDPSLLRPGRLEKTITLGPPDFEARKEIIAGQIKDMIMDFTLSELFEAKCKDDVSSFVAMESAGLSAVEVIAICREASMECLRELNFEATGKPTLAYKHFKSAIKIMKGKSNG